MALDSVDRLEETENNNENEVRKDARTNSSDGGKVKLSNLADLIHLCRDKGYQVYNNKPNIPASDEQSQDEEARYTNNKKHRADDPESRRRYKRKESAMTTRLSTKSYHTGESIDQSSRRTSAKSSILDRSQMTSEMSYTTTSTERQSKSMDADEWHRIRMRRKSRKRREKNIGSLVDVLKKKQEEIETYSIQKLKMDENKDRLESDRDSKLNKLEQSVEKTNEDFNELSKHETNQTKNSKQETKISESVDHIKKGRNILSDKVNNNENINEQTNIKPNKNSSERSEEIRDVVRIKDGDKTLVLYKVKDNTEKRGDTENVQHSDQKSLKIDKVRTDKTKQSTGNDSNNPCSKTDGGSDENSDPSIDEKCSESIENERTHNNSSRQNGEQQNSNEAETKHSDQNVNILDETRVRGGNSTLIPYGVNTKSENLAASEIESDQETRSFSELNGNGSDTKMSLSDDNQINKSHGISSKQKSITESSSTVAQYREINNLHETMNKGDNSPHLHEEHSLNNEGRNSSTFEETKEGDSSHETRGININKNDEKLTVIDNKGKRSITENRNRNNNASTSENKNGGKTDQTSNNLSSPMMTVKGNDISMLEVNRNEEGAQSKNVKTNSSTDKPPKRSIGNGFLVSSDHEDEIESSNYTNDVKEDTAKNVTEKNAANDAEQKSQKHQQFKDSIRESRDSKDTTSQASNANETNNADRSSRTSSKIMSLNHEARMILLFAKVRQTNQQYGVEHLRTIDLLQEARLSLRKDFRNFRNGQEPEADESPRRNAEFYKKVCQDESKDLHEQMKAAKLAKSVEQEIALKRAQQKEAEERERLEAEKKAKEEKEEEEKHQRDEEHYETEDDYDMEPINVDINVGIVKSIKENASSRIDTKWDPKHPIFRKKSVRKRMNIDSSPTERVNPEKKNTVKNTSSSESVKPTNKETLNNSSPTESVKRIKKKGALDATDLPKENEYVREAKRIFPQGFPKDQKGIKKTGQVKSVEPVPTKENDVHERNSNQSKTLNQSPRKGKHNNNNESPRHIDYRKIRYLKNDKSDHIGNTPVRQKEKQQPTKSNGKPPIKDIRKPRNEDDGDNDDRLKIDKAFAKELEAYMMYKSKPSKPVNGKKTYPTKGNSSNANSKENLPNIDDNKYHDHTDTDNEINDVSNDKNVNEYSDNDDRHHVNDTESSIREAVEVVKSRKKFYNDVSDESIKKEVSRDSRVLKLFKQIQCIRRMAEPFSEMLPSDNENSSFSDPSSGFLFMNYGVSYETHQIKNQRSDSALNRFLHHETDYEVCSKLKSLHVPYRKRDKALGVLKQKLYSRT